MFAKTQEQQNKIFEILVQKVNSDKIPELKSDNTELIIESLARNIVEFVPNPENMITFEYWYKRQEDQFVLDGRKLDDASRVRFLLQNLNNLT